MEAAMSLHPVTLIFLAVYLGMGLAMLAVIGWTIWKDRTSEKESREETNRIIRALEALLDQDPEEIRKPMRP